MNSRYLARLESDIHLALDPISRSHLRAEHAGYLARLGRIQEAREEIRQIRDEQRGAGSIRLAILVNIADGLCHYFEDMGPESRDRFLRAFSLAAAGEQDDLQSRAASWLALYSYGTYDFVGMVRYLRGALSKKSSLDAATKSRFCMLLALTAHLANRFDIASPWYQKSRRYAAEIEDEVTLSALMHNMASIWTANLRNEALGGIETKDKSRTALTGAMSTMNFDHLVGALGLNYFTPLIRAQLFSLEGEYENALELYSANLGVLNLRSVKGWQSWLLADRGWCHLRLGNVREGKEDLAKAQASISNDHHIDDQAATLKRLSDCYSMLGDDNESSTLVARSNSCWSQFIDLQGEMLERVGEFSEADI